jgi:hypothetical protein
MKTEKGLRAHSTVSIPVLAFLALLAIFALKIVLSERARLLVVKQPVPNPILFVIEQVYAQIIANQISCPFTSHL